jgi:energy-coupling factor transporter ATP-binding protein EcfA2
MFDKWQAPDRDSPSIDLKYGLTMTEQLRALLSMEGFDGYKEEAVKLRTGKDVGRPRRWHLMFERMGLLYRINEQTHLTDLGKQLLRASASDPRLALAKQALVTLSRYQLKNPVDEEGDVYPDGCDLHPYWAIWKACDELDGKLHWDELNRELMRVFRHEELPAAIERIRAARAQPGYDPLAGGSATAPLSARCYDNETPPEGRTGEGQVRDQRTTPWFKRASLGEYLFASPGNLGNGYWSIRPEFRQLLHDWVSKGPPLFQHFASKDEWYRFLSGQTIIITSRPITDIVDAVSAAASEADVRIAPSQMVRFIASILSKRFLILTGLAGSGKTKLAQAFARWLTPKSAAIDSTDRLKGDNPNPFYALVPIGADWTGNENILGYPNGLDAANYITKPTLDLILHATSNPDIPHFLILDEMNLSHVERYFADILSIIESDEGLALYAGSIENPDTWRQTAAPVSVPPRLGQLPENVFIIGTVNVDETTYMFSPKVLDRANVIEFRMDAAELEGFLSNPAKPDLSKLDGKGGSYGKAFVDAAKNPVVVPADVKAAYDKEMVLLFETLQGNGAEFGYRTAYETARFVHFYKLLGNHADGDDWFSVAFDCVVFQKFLPKLHGSRARLGPVLKKLWFLCVNNAAGRGADALKGAEEAARSTDTKAEPSIVIPEGAPYPLSAQKIARMWRLLIENGFASFAEA